MEHYFEILRRHYGNHSRAARALGINPRHYRRVRNNDEAGKLLRMVIKARAREVSREAA